MKSVVTIVPIYNGENYLARCLNSVLQQNYKNVIVVCVNDGSTDNSVRILLEYQRHYDNIFVINKENGGVSSARNEGLKYVYENFKDFYLSFIDCDDFVDKEYFEKLVEMLEKNNVDVVCSSYFYEFSNRNKKYNQIAEDKIFSSFDAAKILLEDKTVQSHSHCKLFKSNLWEGISFPEDISWMEDQATIFKALYNSKNVMISNYSGYHYWQEGVSACRSSVSNKKVLQSIKGYFIPYDFDYSNYTVEQQKEIKKVTNNALANVYLMMYARFSKSLATIDEKKQFSELKQLIKKNKVIKKYKTESKKENKKRFVYLYLRPFYKPLYKLFIK